MGSLFNYTIRLTVVLDVGYADLCSHLCDVIVPADLTDLPHLQKIKNFDILGKIDFAVLKKRNKKGKNG